MNAVAFLCMKNGHNFAARKADAASKAYTTGYPWLLDARQFGGKHIQNSNGHFRDFERRGISILKDQLERPVAVLAAADRSRIAANLQLPLPQV